MNVIFANLSDIPESQRKFARPVKDGLKDCYLIDSLRILAPQTGAITPCSSDEPEEGCVVLALEDSRDIKAYREALAKVNGDHSRIRIK